MHTDTAPALKKIGGLRADPTPAGLTFRDATAPCAGGFPCALGDLANGASVVITARFDVPVGYAGASASNTATVSAESPDPTPLDNSATAVTTVVPAAPAQLAVVRTVPVDDWRALLLPVLLVAGSVWLAGAVRARE